MIASVSLATPPPDPVPRASSRRQTGFPLASSAQAPEWQRYCSSSITVHNVRKHAFRYTIAQASGWGAEATKLDDGASSDVDCIWKVVDQTSPDEGPAMYTVAFDWQSPVETREDLTWADVESLFNLPTSYYCKL